MQIGHNLDLSQEQQLILTPELKQSLKVLQYNQIELNDFIEAQLVDNPILERQDDAIDASLLNLVKNSSSHTLSSLANDDDLPDDLKYYSHIQETSTLQEHLSKQLGLMKLSPRTITIVAYLINSVNDNGYIEADLKTLSSSSGYPQNVLEVALDILQHMEPSGIGARDLSECLSLQYYDKQCDNPLAEAMIHNDIEAIANNRLRQLGKKYKVRLAEIETAIQLIKSFDPKPGRQFKQNDLTPYVKPDIEVHWDSDGYHIQIDDTYSCPRLIISQYYAKLLDEAAVDEKTLSYIREKILTATAIIRNIDQRKQTIIKVTRAIIEHQKDFFSDENGALKALRMKDIALTIDMHESTVSRTVNGKYLLCPHGIYPLKKFFQQGLTNASGDMDSADDVKERIQQFILAENPAKPLSDQKLVDILTAEGVNISRRTVAKYRTQLGILSTSKRKKFT